MGAGATARQKGMAARSIALNGMKVLRKAGFEPVYQKTTSTRWGQATATLRDSTVIRIYPSMIGPASNGEVAFESVMKIEFPDTTWEAYLSLSGKGELPHKGYWFQGIQRLQKLKKQDAKKTKRPDN